MQFQYAEMATRIEMARLLVYNGARMKIWIKSESCYVNFALVGIAAPQTGRPAMAANNGRPARPGTAGRGRKSAAPSSTVGSANEYPESRGSVEDPLRYA